MKFKILLLVLLLFAASVQGLTVRSLAMDSSYNIIDPATITLNGVTETTSGGYFDFTNVPTDSLLSITHSATGYQTVNANVYFDSQLAGCSGNTCSYTSTTSGVTYVTACTYDSTNQDYECTTTWNGGSFQFIYNVGADYAIYIEYLSPSGGGGSGVHDTSKTFTVITEALDGQTPINPSTIYFGGNLYQGTPTATFTDVPSDSLMLVNHAATGYTPVSNYFYLDHGLSSCSGANCVLASQDENSNTYTTSCTLSTDVYSCSVDIAGFTLQYVYDPSNNQIYYPAQLNAGSGPIFDNSVTFKFRTLGFDAITLDIIDPVTIEFAGNTVTGTPWYDFEDVPADTMYDVYHSATGYETDGDTVYFDHGLSTCSGNSCTLQSIDVYGVPQTTQCTWSSDNLDYECYWYFNNTFSDPRPFVYNPDCNCVIYPKLMDKAQTGNTAPVIVADATPLSGLAPLTVTFTNTVTDDDGLNEVVWIYGDMDLEFVDPVDSTTHTYTSAGNYTAIITAVDTGGLSTLEIFNIEVFGIPECQDGLDNDGDTLVDMNDPGCSNPLDDDESDGAGNNPPTVIAVPNPSSGLAPLTTTITGTAVDNDGTIQSVVIDFGDGTTANVNQIFTINHTYANPNTYAVLITATDDDGATGTESFTVTANAQPGNNPPVAALAAIPNSGTAPLTVTFSGSAADSDGNVTSLVLDFGDGASQSLSNPFSITHTYSTANTFTAVLTATDDDAAAGTDSEVITTSSGGGSSPVLIATAQPLNGVEPHTVNFAGNAIDPEGNSVDINIAFGDGSVQNVSNPFNVNHVYNTGTYRANAIASDGSDPDTVYYFDINVTSASGNLPPVANLTAVPLSGAGPLTVAFTGFASDSDGTVTSLLLDFGDGNSTLVSNPFALTYTYAAMGTYPVSLIATDDDGATGSDGDIIILTSSAQCADGLDNDGDLLIDLADPGCSSPTDNDESDGGTTQCSDGIDNDGDFLVDMNDPGCSSPLDNSETDGVSYQCSDGIDNDGDLLIDLADPGCSSPTDNDESDGGPTQCSDGVDNDGDGLIDSLDPECQNPLDNSESLTDDERDSLRADLRVKSIRFPDWYTCRPGDLVTAYVNFENNGNIAIERMKVSMVIPELNLRSAQGHIDLNPRESGAVPLFVRVPITGIQSGTYLVRFTLSSEQDTRVVHRFVEIFRDPSLDRFDVEVLYR